MPQTKACVHTNNREKIAREKGSTFLDALSDKCIMFLNNMASVEGLLINDCIRLTFRCVRSSPLFYSFILWTFILRSQTVTNHNLPTPWRWSEAIAVCCFVLLSWFNPRNEGNLDDLTPTACFHAWVLHHSEGFLQVLKVTRSEWDLEVVGWTKHVKNLSWL